MIKFQPYILQIVLCVFSEDVICSGCEEGCCRRFFKDNFNRLCFEKNGLFFIEERIDQRDNTWKYLAFTLIGSIAALVAIGLVILMKSWCAKNSKEENSESNESQNGMNSLLPNGSHIEKHKYEGHRIHSSPEEIEASHLYSMSAENNYAGLGGSTLSPIYDKPEDLQTDVKPAFFREINTSVTSRVLAFDAQVIDVAPGPLVIFFEGNASWIPYFEVSEKEIHVKESVTSITEK